MLTQDLEESSTSMKFHCTTAKVSTAEYVFTDLLYILKYYIMELQGMLKIHCTDKNSVRL